MIYEAFLGKDFFVNFIFQNLFCRNLFLLFYFLQGDKDHSSTELALQVLNIHGCNFAYKTHLLGMFEVTDSIDNLQTIFGPFTDEFI